MIDAAVIGFGRWGKGIVESVQGKSHRLRIIRGVSKEPELVRDFAAAKGFELSIDFEEAIADPRVQAVFLATPHSLHIRQIEAVAARGLPVWSEKPLALTRAEAERAIAAVTKAKVPFALGNNKRCFSSMRELKRVVADGTLGDIFHIEGNFSNEHSTRVKGGWRDDPRESPGGGMTGAGLHVIDAFVNLAGPIAKVDARVFAQKPPPDPRDAAAALIEFKSGATGVLATVRAAPMFWRIHVFGTKGSAEARGDHAYRRQDRRAAENHDLSAGGLARHADRCLRRDDRDRQAVSGDDGRHARRGRRVRGHHSLDGTEAAGGGVNDLCRAQSRNFFDLRRKILFGSRKIVTPLQIDPKLGTVAAELAETQRHAGRHRLTLVDDVVERLPRDAEQARNLGLGLAERRQDVLAQQFSRMHGLQATKEPVLAHR